MIPTAERKIMERQTLAFVLADAEEITIAPREGRISDGAGGWVAQQGAPMLPLTVRLIPQSDKVPEAVALEGRRPIPEYILMAMPGVNIERYDTFEWRGRTWQVSHVHDKPEYEFKADVVIHNG